MPDIATDAPTHEELNALRAEVARLRAALERHQTQSEARPRGLFEPDPDLPGLGALWRGERGTGWRMFVQAALTINAALMLIAGIAIVH